MPKTMLMNIGNDLLIKEALLPKNCFCGLQVFQQILFRKIFVEKMW